MLKPDDPVLDERVAVEKFEVALALHSRRKVYRSKRWEVEKPVFPVLRVWFLDASDKRRVGVRFQLRNYDLLPASLTFIGSGGGFMSDQQLGLMLKPPDQTRVPPARYDGKVLFARGAPGGFGGYLPGGHPITGRPFLCIRGTWEFHVHPQHADLPWDWLRGDPNYGLDYLLTHARASFRDEIFT